jgi:thioredoxin reductase
MIDKNNFEAIIIGGSYAGLSAAIALGRSLRNVLIIDSEKPCNAQTPHSHNFITHDGKMPKEISDLAKRDLEKYETVKFYNGLATKAIKIGNGFEITTVNGDVFLAKKIIFATGIIDKMPDIKGFAACWGITLVHCPYCHGYELRHKKTAIFANGDRAFHLAMLVHNLTDNLTILTADKADFKEEQIAKFNKHQIKIIETKITEIEHENGQIKQVIFDDNTKLALDGLYASLPFTQHCDLPTTLGCEMTEQGHIKVDMFQKTTVENVFACGDNSSMMRSVATAVYTGNVTGAMVNGELCNEKF